MKMFVSRKIVLCFFIGVFAWLCFSSSSLWAQPDNIPEPMLLNPKSGVTSVPADGEVEFFWEASSYHYFNQEYYDFKILDQNGDIVYEDKVPSTKYRLKVPATVFNSGEKYCWTLRHVVGVEKSTSSQRYFTINKE